MSAPITEAHRALAERIICSGESINKWAEDTAQLIADSEASAVVADSQGARRQLLIVKHERDQLRAEVERLKALSSNQSSALEWAKDELAQEKAAHAGTHMLLDAREDELAKERARLLQLRADVQFVIDHAGKVHETELGNIRCSELWMAEQLGCALDVTEPAP